MTSLVLVLISVAASGPLLRLADRGRIGSASGLYFETAANWVFCHRYGHVTSVDAANRARVNLAEIKDVGSYDHSVVELIDAGFNWYLNKYTKFYFDWENASFAQPVYDRPGGFQKSNNLFWLRLMIYL